jgi:hypothetical protein
MSRLSFALAKLTGNEDRLAAWSEPFDEIVRKSEGKTVAIVGNSRGLADSAQGAHIDRADIVVRLNRAPMPSARSHGTRTDWLATSIPLNEELIAHRQPDLVLWMTSKRKRLSWQLAKRGSLFINPVRHHRELWAETVSRPTTGLLVIDLLRRVAAVEIHIFGFDFFQSQSLSGSRRAEDVVHDFDAERVWVEHLVRHDPRFHFRASTDGGLL